MACKKSLYRQRRMKASVRHGLHGKPQVRQKRGRIATTSHRQDPQEPRRPKELRPIAASRCTAKFRGPRVEKHKPGRAMKLVTTYRCNGCYTELEYEGQPCTKITWGQLCTGKAIKRSEDWVEI